MAIEQQNWELESIRDLSRGINVLERPDILQEGFVVDAENLRPFGRELRIDTGYVIFLERVAYGIPQKLKQVFYKTGQTDLILVTTLSVYRVVSDTWHFLRGTATTLLDGAHLSGVTELLVDSSTGFLATEKIGIILADGTQHKTTIASIPDATHITLDDGLTGDADNNARIDRAVVLAGALGTPVDIVTIPDSDEVVFTNGVDELQRWNKTNCVDLAGPTSPFTCRSLVMFSNRLFALNTIESAVNFPQRVRSTAAGDITDWTGSDAITVDLFNSEDHIQEGLLLGPLLMIYRERSYVRGTFVGSVGNLIRYEDVIISEGAQSQASIIGKDDSHYIFGNQQIVRYTGGFSIQPLSNLIRSLLLGSAGELHAANKSRVFTISIDEREEIAFFYPDVSNPNPKKMYRMSLLTGAWLRRVFQDKFVCAASWIETTTTTWAAATGSWDDQQETWSSRAFQANSPVILLGGNVNQIYKYDFAATTDAGTVIPFFFITKDFQYPQGKIWITYVELFVRGVNVALDYSIDGGISFKSYGTFSSSSSFKEVIRVYKDVTGDRIRFKLSGSGGGFQIGSLHVHKQNVSAW